MIVKPNAHLGFVCKDLDRTQKFYEDVLGCREKFTLYYGDLIPEDDPERLFAMDPADLRRLEEIADVRWIVYLEWSEGFFIELFHEVGAHVENPYDPEKYGFTHYDIVVDDIHAFRQQLEERGAGECIDIEPGPSVDRNYTMWFHDPEGNRIEVHQYGPEAMQLVGRRKERPGKK